MMPIYYILHTTYSIIRANLMKLDGIIFDFDGTLADTLPVITEAFLAAFERHLDRRFSDAEIAALFGPSEEGIIRRLAPGRWEECLETYYEAYERFHEKVTEPFPGIADALGLLRRRGIARAIVTGKSRRSALVSLDRLGLGGYFDALETGSAEGPVKPRLIGNVLACWGIPAARVAYIGDSAYDIRAAREAGVIPLRAQWAPVPESESVGGLRPREVFDSVGEFIRWIKGIDEDGE